MVLILPGGGYGFTSPREAEPVAMVFNNAGYHAAVLDYSVAPRRHPQPVFDAARALTLVKEHGERWQVDIKQIFVIGFSAGNPKDILVAYSGRYNRACRKLTSIRQRFKSKRCAL